MREPRLPVFAGAFGFGIAVAALARPWAEAPIPWLAGALALLLAGGSPRRRVLCLLGAVAFAGAGRAACEAKQFAERGDRPEVAAAADREPDRLEGEVVGPIEDRPDGRRFHVARGDVRVVVTARGTPPPEVLPGDRVAVRGRLREPRGYRVPGAAPAGRRARVRGARLSLYTDAGEVERLASGWSPWRPAAWLQRELAAAVTGRGGDPEGRAVVRALAAGDRGGLEPELAERFRRAGVAHVLAVSGLHLSAVALLVFAAARRGWALVPGAGRLDPHRAAALLAAVAAASYAMVTGARPSTLRALVAVLAVLAGVATDRRARVLDALGLAALLLLVRRPSSLYDPSFQLSFAAAGTLALVFAGRRPGRGLLARAVGLARASLWASAATAPWAALAFGRVATGGLVANLLVVPLVEVAVLPLGLAGAVLAWAAPAVGGPILDLAIGAGGLAADLAARFAGASPVIRLPPPSALELAGFAILGAASLASARRAVRPRRAAAAALVGAAALAGSWIWTSVAAPALRTELRITFVDVGQGDATVVELPGGDTWLIDAGGRPFAPPEASPRERRRIAAGPGRAVVRFLAHRRIRRLERVILTHPHPDHYAGLAEVLRAVEVDELWVARPHPELPRPPGYVALLVELSLRGTRVVYPPLGWTGAHGGVRARVLGPRYLGERAAVDPVLGVNDNSLALALEFAGRRILLAGDVEEEGEALILEHAGAAVRASDVVKVPHHGSGTSSTPRFVEATRPGLAVVSCGHLNRFGFPEREVVARWRGVGARVLRTDRDGTVTVTVQEDGELEVETYRDP